MLFLNPEYYCIPCRHRLLGQTTKQQLGNFEPQKPWKYKQCWGFKSHSSCLETENVFRLAEYLKVIILSRDTEGGCKW